MPIDVQMPDGTIISGVPDNITQADLLARYKAYTPAATNGATPDELGRYDAAKQPGAADAGFSAKDTAIALGTGIVGAGKSLTDVFGADNAASKALDEVTKGMAEQYSPARKVEMARREELQKQASKGTIGDEISAFLGGVAEAPVQSLAQGLGSIVPYAGTGIIGRVATLGGATVKAINTVLGFAQGAGAVKGSIYDGVKKELEKSGMSPKEAAAKAAKAQEYLGENFLDIAGGAVIGGIGARVGVENMLTPGAAAKLDRHLVSRMGKAVLDESPLEGAQGGQEQLAVNRALQKQGIDVGTFEGVAGSSARDAAVGALTAASVGVRGPGAEKSVAPPPVTPPQEQQNIAPKKPTNIPESDSQDLQAMIDEYYGKESSAPIEQTEIAKAPEQTIETPVAPPLKTKAAEDNIKTDLQALIDKYYGIPPSADENAPPPHEDIPYVEDVQVTEPSTSPATKITDNDIIDTPQGHEVSGLRTQEIPVSELKLSKDVPQFKSDANEKGIVEPLGGKFDRTGVAPIQVWERNNGELEVISGRHRLDLARRSGEKTIPSQVHKESEGFDAIRAASLDALLNIREGQGKVKDYVTYFQRPGYTKEEAESSGVLARATGKRAYSIATNGSSDLIASHRADKISDEAATRIAETAPKDDAFQALGIKLIQDGKSISNTVNTMQAVKAMSSERGEATLDMFGFDDSVTREALAMAKIASRKQADINKDLAAVTGAAKDPETAKKYGIDVEDPEAILAKADQLRQQKALWNNWSSSPELISEIRAEMNPLTQPTKKEALKYVTDKKLLEKLKKYGEPVASKMDAEKRLSNGEQIYGFHEQDERPILLANVEDLDAYPPDLMVALPSEDVIARKQGAKLESAPAIKKKPTKEEQIAINKARQKKKKAVNEEPTHEYDSNNPEIQRSINEARGTNEEPTLKTDTPQFKKWFGDSKVVNEDGSPKALYHGTKKDISTFKVGDGAFGRGIYLTELPDRTTQYWGGYGKLGAPHGTGPDGGNVMPVYVRMENPKVIDTDIFKVKLPEGVRREDAAKYITEQAKKEGYDGLITMNGNKIWEAVVFDPKQIKSAIGNTGDYDSNNTDISKSINEVKGTKEELDQAKEKSKLLSGSKVLWQNGSLALIRAWNEKTGRPLYTPYKSGKIWSLDVSSFTDKNWDYNKFTQAERKTLLDVRSQLEKLAEEKHKTNPYLKFTKDIEFSPDIAPNLKGVITGLTNLLGIKQKIYFTTIENAATHAEDFTGPHRVIGSASASQNENGFTLSLADGNRVVAFVKNASMAQTIETIAHELGHAHMHNVYQNASPEVKKALNDEFLKWAKSIKGDSFAKELVDSLRARKTAKTTRIQPGLQAKNLQKVDTYWRTFSEWYADQTSKWATTSEKPLSIVEKFFSRLGKAMKSFYQKLRNKKYLPTETFKQYMDNQAANVNLEPIEESTFGPISKEDQMTLFSKNVAEAAENTPEKRELATGKNYKGKTVTANWSASEEKTYNLPIIGNVSLKDVIYKIQDKHIDTKRAQQEIEKVSGEIADNINAYEKENLYHGKVPERIKNFLLTELLPAIKEMSNLKITTKEMHDYLHSRHAEEYNNRMNEINKIDPKTGKVRTTPWKLQDRASGMSTKDAREYLKNLDPKKKADLEKVAEKFDAIIKGTQEALVKGGVETKGTIDGWNDTYKFYAPLFRVMDEEGNGSPKQSKGYGVRGAFSKRAMGSEREVKDILASIIQERERALIRVEKARVGHALYGLTLTNPNPDVWMTVNPDAIKNPDSLISELEDLGYKDAKDIVNNFMAEKKTRYIGKQKIPLIDPLTGEQMVDPETGLPMTETVEAVKYKTDNLNRFKDNVFPVRINGKDRFIFFNKENPDAVRQAKALLNLDVDSLGTITSNVGKFTRWFASVNTQYNPVFGGVNLFRDVQGAIVNLSSTPLKDSKAQVLKGVIPAIRGIFNVLRDERAGKTNTSGKWAQAFKSFREEGGMTGYRDSKIRRKEQQSFIDEELAKLDGGISKIKAINDKTFKALFGALSDFNDTLENAVRVSAYVAATTPKDKGGLGLSKQKAAVIGKGITVNFDKKGELSTQINSWFAFFNASVQGSARMAKTLSGPTGRKIMAAGVGIGVAQAVLLAMAGYRDDDPPEFVKERNFIIPLPGGKYATVPYPLGLNILPNVGRITSEFVLTGGKDPGKKVGHLFSSFVDAFSPLGSSTLLQTISPTILDPAVAIGENKDAFGRPIYKADRATNPTPGYMRSRETASGISKTISYYLNLASGGGKYSKGYLSPTADEIDYIAGQVTGGAGREVMKVYQAIKASSEGEEIPAYRAPVVGRFYGETESPAAESQRFYENIVKMADHENEIKGRQKNKEPVGPYMANHPESRLWQTANDYENKVNALNKQKKEFIEKGLPKERIKQIEQQKVAMMKRFNDQLAKYEK